jgi:type IV pilus assembly protein PilP
VIKKQNIIKLVFSITLLTMLVGCQQEKTDLRQFVAEVKARGQTDIPDLPTVKVYQSYAYSADDLRDPFTRTVVEQFPETSEVDLAPEPEDNGIKPDKHRTKELLEYYSLSSLQLMGTLEQDTLWALVRSPDGVIHRVTKGNYLGMNHGQILEITETELLLKEIMPEGNGRYVERESSISVLGLN